MAPVTPGKNSVQATATEAGGTPRRSATGRRAAARARLRDSAGLAARILLTRPGRLADGEAETLALIEAACPQMTALTALIRSFAGMLAPAGENGARLQQWITNAREADLPRLHSFTRGPDLDIQAATAALTLPYHNGRTEGVNNKTKMIKRQMYGRAGFTVLRHRILLN